LSIFISIVNTFQNNTTQNLRHLLEPG